MRFLLSLCLLLAVSSTLVCAQWSVVYSDSLSLNLYDIQFVTPTLGYVLGDDGSQAFVLKTTDAGTTWSKKPVPATYANKLHFSDALNGCVMQGGAPVRLMTTTDGGASWSGQSLDSSFIVMGFGMPKADIGYYMNNAGRFRKFKLTSGIASFSYITDTLPDGTNLHFTDSLHGFSPHIYYLQKTTDGGLSWLSQPTGIGEDLYGRAFHFTTAQHGYAGTRDLTFTAGHLWRTTDAGVSWLFADDFTAVTLHAHDNVVLAADDTAHAAISTDGGITWWHEPLGLALGTTTDYVAEVTPGDELFLITSYEGKILKRTTSLAQAPERTPIRWSVYPNPADEVLHLSGLPQGTEALLFNAVGQEVLRGTAPTMQVGELPSGMYLLRAAGESRRVVVH